MTRGKFIVVDGGDFTGKTSSINAVSEQLNEMGITNIVVNDPNSILPLAKVLRQMIVYENKVNSQLAETLCFLAARAELNDKLITPTLDRGVHVLCDRYVSSTIAYQGYGRKGFENFDKAYFHHRNLFAELIENELITLRSALTVILSVNDEVKKKRILMRGNDISAFDKFEDDFHKRVAIGYQSCVDNAHHLNTEKLVHIDTSPLTPDQTHAKILEQILNVIQYAD